MVELVYILPDVEGGVSSVVYNLIAHTPCEQFSNTVILLDNCKSNHITRELQNCKVIRITIKKNDSLYSRCKKLARIIPKDAVIVSNDGGIEIDTVKLFKLQNPVVYIIHGDFNYYYNIIKNKHQLIDTFISVSEYVATKTNSSLKEYGSSKQVKAIHFPVPAIDSTMIPFNKPIKIIFVGSLIKRKGVQFFPKFIEQLSRSSISFEFSIVGAGDLKHIVTELEQKYENVHYLGSKNHEEVLEILKEHHVLFLPSLSEGLPVTIIEGMKSGLVPISSDIKSGIPEIVNNNTGYLIKPGYITGYINAIADLYFKPEKFRELKRNAITLANIDFNPQKQTRNYLDEFKRTMFNEQKHVHSSKTTSLIARLPDQYRLFITNLILPKEKHNE